MTVKEHYDNHLGNFYSWMVGDFDKAQDKFSQFLHENNLAPRSTKIALDLGAGHGVQSLALAKMGYSLISIDFSKQLLEELRNRSQGLDIKVIEDDFRAFANHLEDQPELILCWGDTLTHLDSKQSIEKFIHEACEALPNDGRFVLSFRDYSIELTEESRFIPVKSNDNRILTCFLEYSKEHVKVTDLLNEKQGDQWVHKISSYNKVRISPKEVLDHLNKSLMVVDLYNSINGLTTVIATRKC